MERFNFANLTGNDPKLAQALGAYGEHVGRPGDVALALERASEITTTGRPALLEILTRQETVLSKYGPE